MGKLTKFSNEDIISDLPENIFDSILSKLPIRDAVRTSVLSSKWKYQWTTMKELVFDEKCLHHPYDRKVAGKELVDFIMRFLLLHDGPIQKFELSTTHLKNSTAIDQWLRVISRKDIKEVVLYVHGYEWQCEDPRISVPRSIFSFRKLTRLTLSAFTVKPPLEFQGFPFLKYLELGDVAITLEVIENFISGCPLLETFNFDNMDNLALTVCAPNLKHLTVGGNFEYLCFEHALLVVAVSICFYPMARRGDILMKVPVTYDYLKFIEIGKMDYNDMDEVLYVLHLLLQSPNLQELHISGFDHCKAVEFDIWERKCPADFTFKCLKTVKLSNISTKNDREFVKFVLGRSPVLEVISISPDYEYGGAMNMVNEVLLFRRASPEVKIKFFD